MIKQGKITGTDDDEFEYKVDFANIIRNIKQHLFKMNNKSHKRKYPMPNYVDNKRILPGTK